MVPMADMGDALGLLEFGLAFPQVAKHQQSGQAVGKAAADRLEKALLSLYPITRIGALVQAEQIRLISLRIDRYRDHGLYSETLRDLRRHGTAGSGTELYCIVGSPRGSKYLRDFRIDGQIRSQSEGTGITRPSMLHHGTPRWRVGIARVNQPCAVAFEDREHRAKHVAHHLLEVVGALNGPVDLVHAFQEPDLGLAFLLRLLAFGHVNDGTHEFGEVAGCVKNRVADQMKVPDPAIAMDHSIVQREISSVAGRPFHHFGHSGPIIRMDSLENFLQWWWLSRRVETNDARALLGPVSDFAPGRDPCPTAGVTQPLPFRQVGFTLPKRLLGLLALGDIHQRPDEDETLRIFAGGGMSHGSNVFDGAIGHHQAMLGNKLAPLD